MSLKEVRLTIGGNEIDLFDTDKLRLAVTRSIDEIQKTEKSNASRSKTIVIPGTKRNDLALGFGQDVNSVTAISQNQKPDAVLEVGGTIIIEGFARATKRVIKNSENTHEYHLILIGDNGEWKHSINGLNLRDLDYSEFDHVYNKANIDDSELTDSSGGPLTKPDIVYPLINYGGTLDMPHPVQSNRDLHTVRIKNRFPAIQKRSLLLKIFNNAGFKIKSDFIDSDFFSRLYMPFTREALIHPESFRTPLQFRVGSTSEQIAEMGGKQTAPFFDNGDNYSDVQVLIPSFLIANNGFFHAYTVPEDSMMNFILQTSHSKIGTGFSGGFSGNSNEIGILRPDGSDELYQSAVPDYPNGQPQIRFKVRHETGMQFWPKGTLVIAKFFQPNTESIESDTFFSNEVLLGVQEGNDLDMNINLPDIEQIDFVRALRDEFSLMIDTNLTTREVTIEPHDDFYTTKAIDWTDKLDKAKDEEIEDLNGELAKTLNYAFRNDSKDEVVEQIRLQDNVELASLDVENSNKFVEGTQTIGNGLFAPTFMDVWPYVGLFTAKVPRLNQDVVDFPSLSIQSTDFLPRSLYYDGIITLPDGEQWNWEGVNRSDYPYMYSVDEEKDNDNSLYWNNTRRSVGLFQKYHRNRFEIRDKGKLYTAFFNLNDTDMSNLDFRVPIFVVDTYYLLNKVENYDPLSNVTTKVELITAININIKAIIDELTDPVFPPLPPITVIPISTGVDGSTQQNPGTYQPTSPTFGNSSDGFGIQALGQGNESNEPGITSYGAGLNLSAGQVGYGNNNQLDDTAQVLIGAGSVTESKTVGKVAEDGTFKSGNGSTVRATVAGVSHEMTYTDKNGEEQPVVMTDKNQLGVTC